MVNVGTGGAGTRFIKRNYPVTEGLIAGTTKLEGKQTNLVPEEDNLVSNKDKVGLQN